MSASFQAPWRRAGARLLTGALLALAGPAIASHPTPPVASSAAALPGQPLPALAGRLPATLPPPPQPLRLRQDDKKNGDKKDNGDKKPEAAPAPAPAGVVLALDEARGLAQQRQPALAAARASLAVAEARCRAVEGIRAPTFLVRDLPARRQQSSLGIQVAAAGLHLAEINTDYGVQYSYLTYLFARSQQAVADDAVTNLKRLRGIVKSVLDDEGGKLRGDFNKRDLNTIDTYIALAEGRREEAVKGQARALSALREALGMGCDGELALANSRLFDIKTPPLSREVVVSLALSRRPEITQANLGIEVTALEVCAQDKHSFNPRQQTFAAGSDLHANPLPAGSYDFDYKPGAIGPEMPVQIAGSRQARVEQANLYLDRSRSVAEKARGLIRLESEQAYLRFVEARDKLPKFEKAHKEARAAFKDIQERFVPENDRVKLDQFLSAALLATQMRVYVNEARYQMLVGLALLERVTAGGLPAGLGAAAEVKESE